MRSITFVIVAAAAASLVCAAPARAYTFESLVSDGCHEAITADALRRARTDLATAAPLPASADDRRWIHDVPFHLEDDMRDLGAATLLVGVRDNDLKGRHGLDTTDLPHIHGDPDAQREHCLRRPEQDEPDGSAAAVADCRAYIHDTAAHAIDTGLDAAGYPDPARRTVIDVHLAIAGDASVPMPIFYVYMGQAMHALEDSFTHCYRSSDGTRVTVALNWVDFATERLDEKRDGPAHALGLDQCDDVDAFLTGRRALATNAASELLHASLDPALAPDQKIAAVDAVLDAYLTYQPGCTFDNRWCDAQERLYSKASGCACRAAPVPEDAAPPWAEASLALVLVALAWARRFGRRSARERSGRGPRVARAAAAVAVAALVVVIPCFAQAQATPRAVCAPGRQLACACLGDEHGVQRCAGDGTHFSACECPFDPTREHGGGEIEGLGSPLALYTSAGAALDETALALSIGGRYRLTRRWLVGADLEWNPWASLETRRVHVGSLNVYATLVWRTPIRPWVAIRSSAHLGVSTLLFDVYGADAGSIGPYVGLSLIGVELAISRRWRLVIDPADVALAVPHLTGVPLTYRQYRFTLGLQIEL